MAVHLIGKPGRGGFGVDIFFVISGFLITSIILSSLEKNSFSFGEFYGRRIRRIFPAALLVLVATAVSNYFIMYLAGEAEMYKKFIGHVMASAFFIENYWIDKYRFISLNSVSPFWSLSVEEQFYLFFPLLLWIAYKIKFSSRILWLLILSVSFYFYLFHFGYYIAISRYWELAMGGVLAYIFLHKKNIVVLLQNKKIANGVALLGLIFLSLSLIKIHGMRITTDLTLEYYRTFAVLATGCFLSSPRSFFNQRVLAHPYLVAMGKISYPLYLWHIPIIMFFAIMGYGSQDMALIIIIFLSFFLSYLTYRYIEMPIKTTKNKKFITIFLFLAMMAVGGLSLLYLHFMADNATGI